MNVVDLEKLGQLSLTIPGMITPEAGKFLYTLCYMQDIPGDVVEIREGVLYVNEQMVDEPYATMPMSFLNEPPRIVESGTLYVMGDNRPASSDTRDWGLLNQDLVIGQAWLAIFPLETFGLVDHPNMHFSPGMAQGP